MAGSLCRAASFQDREITLTQAGVKRRVFHWLEPLYAYAIESGITNEFGIETASAIVRAAFAGRAEL